MIKNTIFILTASFVCCGLLTGQGSQLQSIEDVISGIDSLLQEIDGAVILQPKTICPLLLLKIGLSGQRMN